MYKTTVTLCSEILISSHNHCLHHVLSYFVPYALHLLLAFAMFCALNVISLSDSAPNGEFFNLHNSPVNPEDPQNVSLPLYPYISPPKLLTNLYNPRACIQDFTICKQKYIILALGRSLV